METTQLFLNEQLITLKAEPHIIKRLNEEDDYLSEYINKATKMGQFDFLFKDSTVKKIVVRRATTSKPVWNRKGKPSEDDLQATSLLLQLRASDKYAGRFTDKFSFRNKLWEEIASDMKSTSGFEVDGPKCAQKFLNLSKSYYKYKTAVESGQALKNVGLTALPEFYEELHNILVNCPVGNEVGDENHDDSGAKSGGRSKRKRVVASDSDDEEGGILGFLQKHFKRKQGDKDSKYQEILCLFKERTNLMKQKLEQNERMITLLETLIESTSS